MRDLVYVIDEMLNVIPEKEKDFIRQLKRIQRDTYITAPENMVRWEEVSYALQDYLYNPVPTKEWQYEILSIWSTRSIEDVKADCEEYIKELDNEGI